MLLSDLFVPEGVTRNYSALSLPLLHLLCMPVSPDACSGMGYGPSLSADLGTLADTPGSDLGLPT